jgi:hypothetical protein
VWTLLQPDYAHSGGDRTAGDDDALASAVNELRYLGGETRKLFCVERVGAWPSENAGAELEENAPGFSGHARQLSKSENESAQEYLVRRYEHNYFRGWVVGTQRQGKQYQRYFSDKPHGRRESLRTGRVFICSRRWVPLARMAATRHRHTHLWLHLLLLLHHGSVAAGPKGLSDYAENENLCCLLLR